MSRRSTIYGLIAAVIATAVSGVFYIAARWRFAALRDAGEGDPQDLMSAVSATNLSLLIMFVMGLLTVALFTWFMMLRSREVEDVSA